MFKRILSIAVALCAVLCALGAPFDGASASTANTYYIEVDIANQITTVYRKSNKALVRQMICSTGTGNRTPRGTFRLQKTRASTDRKPWYYISAYHCYVKYATRIRGGILFHSIPYTDKDLNSIDRKALAQLGSKASHGCIRLRWQDARWIAQNCPDGTTVKIFTGAAKKTALRKLLLKEGYSEDCGMTYAQFLESDFAGDSVGSLGRGATGEAVTALQERLLGLGFLGGTVTGVYDNATIVAVMRYQAAVGVAVSGVAGKALVSQIMAENDIAAEYATLVPGVSGTLVTKYQQVMKAIGFYAGAVDGVYGDDLAAALAAWCACMGVENTEKITPEMRIEAYRLLKDLNARFGEGRFRMLLLNEEEITARTRLKAPLYAEASSASKLLVTVPKGKTVAYLEKCGAWCRVSYGKHTGYITNGKLKLTRREKTVAHWGLPVEALGKADLSGDTLGSGVMALQDRLRALGFFAGENTPLYDSATVDAVKAYQSAAGLKTTGRADVALQRAMMESDGITGIRVTLSKGMNSPAVAALQRTLSALQYFSGKCGGNYNSATARAVKLFTRANGMTESAVATPEVQQAILEQYLDCEQKYGHGNYTLTITAVESRLARVTARTTLYKKASAGSKALATLGKGDEAALISEGETWCELKINGRTGYARTKYLKRFTRTWQVAVFNGPEAPGANAIVYGNEAATQILVAEAGDGAAEARETETSGAEDAFAEACEAAGEDAGEAELVLEPPEDEAFDPMFVESRSMAIQ